MAKILAKLATKTLIPTGEGFGGFTVLGPCDVAHALAGLDEGPTALLRAVYAKDFGQSNICTLHRELVREINRLSLRHGWQADPKIMSRIASRLIDESIYPHLSMCPHCGGSGHVHPNQHNPKGDCVLCQNTGARMITDEESAHSIGVPMDAWKAIWRKRFAMAYAVKMSWETAGLSHLRERLK